MHGNHVCCMKASSTIINKGENLNIYQQRLEMEWNHVTNIRRRPSQLERIVV